jgi:predicted Zn-dependent peptidase
MVKKSILDCGLTVLSEYIDAFPSFSMSYTVRGGSRMEVPENNGIYHLIEHMMFKGTDKYNLKEIADISDRLGGKLNAFTSKEITQFYIKAIDEHVDQSYDLLTEMVLKSIFPEDEFNKEKGVAIQEIHESEDNPDTNAFETFYQHLFADHGLGYPVGGQVEPVSAFQRDSVYAFFKHDYAPDNMLLSAVGHIDHDRLVHLASKAFNDFPTKKPRRFSLETPSYNQVSIKKSNSSLNQVYMIMSFEGIPVTSKNRYMFMVMNDILGGGMSSRMFQKIREEKGLAYTVSSFTDTYLDCGLQLIYAIVKPDKVEECLDAVKSEIVRLKKEGISNAELLRARDSIKSSIILGLESNVSKMRFNVNNQLFLGRDLTPGEIIDNINNITVDDISELLQNYLDLDTMSLFLYGDVDSE